MNMVKIIIKKCFCKMCNFAYSWLYTLFKYDNIDFRKCWDFQFRSVQSPKEPEIVYESISYHMKKKDGLKDTLQYVRVKTSQCKVQQVISIELALLSSLEDKFWVFVKYFGSFCCMNKDIFTFNIDDIYEWISPKYLENCEFSISWIPL